MANLEQVQQELRQLQDQARQGFRQLHQAYQRYLKSLAPIAQQQLLTAAYQVCTQIVPERFLKLEPDVREKLQRRIYVLGEDLRLSLEELLPEQPFVEEPNPIDTEPPAPEDDHEAPSTAENPAQVPTKTSKALPEANLDMATAKLLHQAAYGVNRALQKVKILPEFPWEQILEIVLKAEGRPLSRLPNIMMVMIANPETLPENPPPARPPKSNHNPPANPESSLAESREDSEASEPEGEEVEDFEAAEKQESRDIAAFFQALMKQRFKDADAEEEEHEDDQDEDYAEDEEKDQSANEEMTLAQEVAQLQAELNGLDVPPADDRPIPLIAIYLHLEDLDFNHPGLATQRQQIRQLKIKLAQLHEKIAETFRQTLVLEASRAWRETWPQESQLPES